MKKLFLIFLITFISCDGQKKKDTQNNPVSAMKKFDIEKFNANKDKRGIYQFSSDGKNIEQMAGSDEEFVEEIIYPAPYFYSFQNIYDAKGHIKSSTQLLSNVAIGKSKEFDEKGNVVKEIDEDKKFGKITYREILKLISEKNDLNLQDNNGWFTDNRLVFEINFDEKTKVWTVRSLKGNHVISKNSPNGQALSSSFYHEIDGNTGKIIK